MTRYNRRELLERGAQVGAGLWVIGHAKEIRADESSPDKGYRVADIQKLRVVDVARRGPKPEEVRAEIAIIGGGLGGVAAAISACDAGRTVCLFEETDWIGGQATSQGVTALDENRYVETSGATRTYMAFRNGIRDYYRKHVQLTPEAAADKRLNPGRSWMQMSFEPEVGVKVLDEMLAHHRASGKLKIFLRCKAYAVNRSEDRVNHVDLVDLDSGQRYRTRTAMVIDATELGDLLALGAADFAVGAESKAETGEPHAYETADAEDVQSFTYSFYIEHCPGGNFVIQEPADYVRNRDQQPYTLTLNYGKGRFLTYGIFTLREKTYGTFWKYRRTIDVSQFADPRYPNDIALINWPGNDYRGGNILVDDPEEQIAQLRAGCDLSLGFLYWLQTEVARDEGGQGYPEFKLRPDMTGTASGLVKFPYIRESRRIRAVKTILEQEVTNLEHPGPRAVHFDDSVGIGFYGIDLHESKRNRKQVTDPTKPFQIPLGALIPRTTSNLLAGCKNIGTTHLTNGCYRLHAIEWGIGEAAGLTAALCIEKQMTPHEVHSQKGVLRELQRRLVGRGAPIMWYSNVGPADAQFTEAQLLPFEKPGMIDKLSGDLKWPAAEADGSAKTE